MISGTCRTPANSAVSALSRGVRTTETGACGGNLLALQKILGQSKFEMTQTYSHLAPDYMVGEIARLSL